jgi:BirA family biotin operon repressor/biotin-[acetyl-CoA-carboxylase] ligase
VIAIGAAVPRIGRHERFSRVGSTNDVVREWLAAGEPEICIAVADEQTAGRGRNGRAWTAPPRSGLLLSLGFRPTWLAPDAAWQLAATASLAMADAGEDVAGLSPGSIALKWPNDLVIVGDAGRIPKLGGVLGETEGLGTADPRVVVGIGFNADWPSAAFPAELAATMTSLRAAAADRPVDSDALLGSFMVRLDERMERLFRGHFDGAGWAARQVTTGRRIDLELPHGAVESVVARGVDPVSGALIVSGGTDGDDHDRRAILVAEIRHVRLATV